MGETLGKLFVDPAALPGGELCNYTHAAPDVDGNPCHEAAFGGIQVFFLICVYGYVLSWASNLISDGSELLLLVPSMRGIVGTVVLPILGAVPDGAIVLFSGLGKDAASQVAVGVGALAGSTIMLLTIPWALAIIAGRVDLKRNKAQYTRPFGRRRNTWLKLEPRRKGKTWWAKLKSHLFGSGVTPHTKVHLTGKIMMATALTYFIIQIPAFIEHHENASAVHAAHTEHTYALVGIICCLLLFCAYLFYQVKYADISDSIDKAVLSAIAGQIISASHWLAMEIADEPSADASNRASTSSEMDPLMGHSVAESNRDERIRAILRPFFNRYDLDGNGTIDVDESRILLHDLGADDLSKESVERLLAEMDKDNNREIDFDEFVDVMKAYYQSPSIAAPPGVDLMRRLSAPPQATAISVQQPNATSSPMREAGGSDEDAELGYAAGGENEQEDNEEEGDDDEGEMPEEFKALGPKEQQRAILMRSFRMMALGTFVVLLFSDPMVDVLDSFGQRINVPPFFVAFVLAPMASNASELIAAYSYAQKKTQKTVTVSFSTLLGAAIMNNTFCLGIFFIIIYIKDSIPWTFSAETISILIIELAMCVYAHKATHRLFDAIVILSLYPLSLVLVALLKLTGMDDS